MKQPCLPQGVCNGGVCVCSPGHRGLYCEIPPTCAGAMDVDGNCCPSSVISASGQCCTQVRHGIQPSAGL